MFFIAAAAIRECGQPVWTHPYGVRIRALEEIGREISKDGGGQDYAPYKDGVAAVQVEHVDDGV